MTTKKEDYLEILKEFGIFTYKLQKEENEIVLKDCPFCLENGITDKPYHLYVNRWSGVFHCFICNSSGTFKKLIRTFKKIYGKEKKVESITTFDALLKSVENLWKTKAAIDFLVQERMISEKVIREFLLGYSPDEGSIIIPYILQDKIVAIKKRNIFKKEYKAEKGSQLKDFLFNQEILYQEEIDSVYITEGELDCLCLISQGLKNVVSVSGGASSIHGSFIELLKTLDKVYVVFDNDPVGQMYARQLIKNIDYKGVIVKLPFGIKDVTEFFKSGKTLEDFLNLPTEEVEVEKVAHIKDIYERWLGLISVEKEGTLFIPLPFEALNDSILVNGRLPTEGDFVILTGVPKIGKTTFLAQWSTFLAQKGIPVLFICLEMPPFKLIERFLWSCNFYGITIDEGIPLYIAETQNFSLDFLKELVKECTKRYGIRIVIFDNIHFLTTSSPNIVQETSRIATQLKLIAEENNIVMIAVAHLNKAAMLDKSAPTATSIRDSALLRADADYVFVLHRVYPSHTIQLILDESRYVYGKLALEIEFDIEKKVFLPISNQILTP